MRHDDPRHGTVAGYNRIPCRDECCRLAMARYKKRWEWDRANGRVRIVSTLGTRRRIEALNWLGWSRAAIADRMGMHATNMTRLITTPTMTAALAARFAAVYEELCMTLPTGNQQAIISVRNRARRLGYVPPLAWDDIDRDPAPVDQMSAHDVIDEAVIDRLLAGERIDSTRAEKVEALRKWMADGGSQREFCLMHGWKQGRYLEREDAA